MADKELQEDEEEEDFVPQFGGTPKKKSEMPEMSNGRSRAPVAVHPAQQQQYHQSQQYGR